MAAERGDFLLKRSGGCNPGGDLGIVSPEAHARNVIGRFAFRQRLFTRLPFSLFEGIGLALFFEIGPHALKEGARDSGIVEFQGLPRLARAREALCVASGIEGRDGQAVGHDMIGMPVAAVFVVANEHLGAMLAHQRDDAL